ncbi:MAG: VIT domain-containing protein, partial [Archangium sp.]|nr:VIT domain-containing protein [Archangium sp.]
MSFAPRTPSSVAPYESSGGRLITTDGRALPLIGASLAADAKGGLVRITLEQTFRNPHDEPLRVTYSLPLPADGAVSGFAFRIGEERVVGQVDAKARARQRFEDAILEGRTAAILDQERSSLFTQEVGNVPPRTQVICEVQIDQKLTWLPDGAWEWRFPTVVAPRYLGAPGRVADHAQVSVDVADAELPVKLSLSMAIRDRLPENARPESPSHTLHSGRGLQRTDVTFADERGAGLDRD